MKASVKPHFIKEFPSWEEVRELRYPHAATDACPDITEKISDGLRSGGALPIGDNTICAAVAAEQNKQEVLPQLKQKNADLRY